MQVIAHRGWSSGGKENTLSAFRRATADPGVAGVELDLRRRADGSLVVSHDPPGPGRGALSFEEPVQFFVGTRLAAFAELKEPCIETDAARQLAAGGLADRAVIFGFPEVLLPMQGERRVRLGVIVRYPWQIPRLAAA